MPVCDGFEACRNIKKMFSNKVIQEREVVQEVKRSSNSVVMDLRDFMPHIIAVSGHVDGKVRADSEQAGFKAIFSVPLTFNNV
jgi:CheY-like chemotaxis protein